MYIRGDLFADTKVYIVCWLNEGCVSSGLGFVVGA